MVRIAGHQQVLVGIAGGPQFIVTRVGQYVVQAAVDDEFRGRVIRAYSLAWGVLMPIGGLLLGVGI